MEEKMREYESEFKYVLSKLLWRSGLKNFVAEFQKKFVNRRYHLSIIN